MAWIGGGGSDMTGTLGPSVLLAGTPVTAPNTIDLQTGLTEFFNTHPQAAASILGQASGRPRNNPALKDETGAPVQPDPQVSQQNAQYAASAVQHCITHQHRLAHLIEENVTNEDMRSYLSGKGLAKYGSKNNLLARMLAHWGVDVTQVGMEQRAVLPFSEYYLDNSRNSRDPETGLSRRGRRENPTNDVAEKILALAGNGKRPKDKVRALAQILDPGSRLLDGTSTCDGRVTDPHFYDALMAAIPGLTQAEIDHQVRHAMSTKPATEEPASITAFLEAFVRKEVKRQAEKRRNRRIALQKKAGVDSPNGMDAELNDYSGDLGGSDKISFSDYVMPSGVASAIPVGGPANEIVLVGGGNPNFHDMLENMRQASSLGISPLHPGLSMGGISLAPPLGLPMPHLMPWGAPVVGGLMPPVVGSLLPLTGKRKAEDDIELDGMGGIKRSRPNDDLVDHSLWSGLAGMPAVFPTAHGTAQLDVSHLMHSHNT